SPCGAALRPRQPALRWGEQLGHRQRARRVRLQGLLARAGRAQVGPHHAGPHVLPALYRPQAQADPPDGGFAAPAIALLSAWPRCKWIVKGYIPRAECGLGVPDIDRFRPYNVARLGLARAA